jgi:hypothetical protein
MIPGRAERVDAVWAYPVATVKPLDAAASILNMSNYVFHERVTSNRTEALFVVLALLFIALAIWRLTLAGLDFLTGVFLGLSCFFSFYALNYRTLIIRLTPEILELRFGIFGWKIATTNIENCALDTTLLWRIGGAGIHFSPIHGRYRAMFNFLEHPRIVIALRQKHGLVQDIAFSTRHPAEVLRSIEQVASTATAR